ncbi:MAG: hypothetical protein JXB38_14605 [Anaerolineales bacterium]|nr:hypothetical protein [Anaerolineales bacterium]
MEEKSDELVIVYHWVAGSMPPPHHYEYMITLGPGFTGQIDYQPDYAFEGVPVWREEFALESNIVEELHELLVAADVFTRRWQAVEDGAVGGSLQWLDVSYQGEQYKVPTRVRETEELEALYRFIRACVPEAVWGVLRAKREKYIKASGEN